MTLGISVIDGGVKNPRIVLSTKSTPVFIGTAKGPTTAGTAPVIPVLANSFTEYVEAMGWAGSDQDTVDHDYTLDEAAYLLFKVHKTGPGVFLNVYNATDHTGGVSDVDAADIVAILPKLENIISDLAVVPAFITAPRWSQEATVTTALKTYTTLGGSFPVMVLVDLDEDNTVAESVTDATALTNDNMVSCFPERGGYPLSAIIAAAACAAEAGVNGIPYATCSNKSTGVTKLEAETSITLTNMNSLDAVGCATVKRSPGTEERIHLFHLAAYDSSGTADYINDMFMTRRLSNYLDVILQTSLIDRVDSALNTTLIEDVVKEVNDAGATLLGVGAALGFICEFLPEDNAISDLQTGKITIRITWLPVTQAASIVIKKVIDLDYLNNLFV